MTSGYAEYERGLSFIAAHGYEPLREVRTRADWNLAHETLASLESAVIGAGRNTYAETRDRAERARAVFRQLPEPCRVTLYHVAEPCRGVGHGGACPRCTGTVKRVMRRTCERYGIVLETEGRKEAHD